MKRQFTKYPTGYVKASSEEADQGLVGYGINYRNMHTAVHGIIWTPDQNLIDVVDRYCQAMESAEDEGVYNDYMSEIESYFASNELFLIEEINYRDITKDNKYYYNKYYCDDGEYIQIVNPVAYDLYI